MTRKVRSTSFDRPFRMVFDIGAVAELSDGELLERFANRQGEGAELAFAALLERHGPMVFRVCRRVLGDRNDALDAFQATFLVLVRRVNSVRKADSIASWLHGVAFRVASSDRLADARRRKHERRAIEGFDRTGGGGDPEELGSILHGELDRLPERYRMPLVLCYLEGMTHEQAADRLGWPVGTVKSRMARGRDRLKVRLSRRGIEPSDSPGGMGVSKCAPPPIVLDATARAAAKLAVGQPIAGMVPASAIALMQGVLKTMTFQKIKLALSALVLTGIVAATAAVLAQQPQPLPVPTPVAGGMITYETNLAEIKGYEWRKEFHKKLKLVAHKGSVTVWAVDAATLQSVLGKSKQVAPLPRVTAWKDAKAIIDSQNEKTHLIVGFKDFGENRPSQPREPVRKNFVFDTAGILDAKIEAKAPDGPLEPHRIPDLDEVSDGVKVEISGHRVANGVLVRAQLVSQIVVSIAQLRVPERISQGDKILTGQFPMMVPETIEAQIEGEWLVPDDGALIVGLGIHRFPTRWSHEMRERLVVIRTGDLPPQPAKEAEKTGATVDPTGPKVE